MEDWPLWGISVYAWRTYADVTAGLWLSTEFWWTIMQVMHCTPLYLRPEVKYLHYVLNLKGSQYPSVVPWWNENINININFRGRKLYSLYLLRTRENDSTSGVGRGRLLDFRPSSRVRSYKHSIPFPPRKPLFVVYSQSCQTCDILDCFGWRNPLNCHILPNLHHISFLGGMEEKVGQFDKGSLQIGNLVR
jgi:hypothetical protein